jgi:energy-coupling factor transport system ATP-binding protein
MIRVQGLTVQYASRNEPTLHGVEFNAAPGEFVLLCGPTGCGKSTLVQCLNGILFHESAANITGEVRVGGADPGIVPLHDLCRTVATVFQSPDAQVCTGRVDREVAFALENLAMPREEMRARIEEALLAVGLSAQAHSPTATLSGGQKQRLAIACALALRPRVLLLDEPISQVDPEGSAEILAVLDRIKREWQCTIVVVEHRLEEVAPLADRVVILDRGAVLSDLPAARAFTNMHTPRNIGLALPHLPDLFCRLGRPERPLDAETAPLLEVRRKPLPDEAGSAEPVLLEVDNLRFRYHRNAPLALDGIGLTLRRGDRVALLGGNGSGKSTLLRLVAADLRPSEGRIDWTGREDARHPAGLVLQQPDLMLFQETVREELAFAPRHLGFTLDRTEAAVTSALDRMGLAALANDAPFALSRGQRLRTAVASVLTLEPRILLLDEPTTGLDREHIERMMDGLAASLDALVFCTHDVDTAARHANRVILLHAGQIAADGPARAVLADEDLLRTASVRPTSALRYARRLGIDAVTVNELEEALR